MSSYLIDDTRQRRNYCGMLIRSHTWPIWW